MPTLSRGQKIKLADLTPNTFLGVGLYAIAPGLTFDVSCFGVDANNQLSDDRYFVFYNQKSSPEGALRQMGAQGGDSETFAVDLNQLPRQIRRLIFTITIDGNGTMAQLGSGHIRIVAAGQELAKFAFTGQDFATEKAIIAGEIYYKDEWRVAAVGQGFAGGLSALLKHFGGEEVGASTASPHTPAAPRFLHRRHQPHRNLSFLLRQQARRQQATRRPHLFHHLPFPLHRARSPR